MTRKDELMERAQYIANWANHSKVTADEILEELIRVEREVLRRVDTYYSHHIHHDMDDYPDKFVKWLKSQQQELK